MASIAESIGNQSQINAGLIAGVAQLSANQTITFIQYQRKVLPLDGYIFWVNTGQSFTAQGSLHVAKHVDQREDETIGISKVTFTAEQEIQDFDAVQPGTIFIGSIGEIRFAFSDQANFYTQAGLFHYRGDAIYPTMEPQIIDVAADLPSELIVSNSLPLWLSLPTSTVFGKTAPTFAIYPSFCVPQDAAPPYASIQIEGSDTEAIQALPSFDANDSHWQLCRDHVKITMYGLDNQSALDFQDYIFQYSLNTDNIGLMNIPVMRDEKRTQRELGIIAQKKSFVIDVSYYQSVIEDLARQLILSAPIRYLPNSL